MFIPVHTCGSYENLLEIFFLFEFCRMALRILSVGFLEKYVIRCKSMINFSYLPFFPPLSFLLPFFLFLLLLLPFYSLSFPPFPILELNYLYSPLPTAVLFSLYPFFSFVFLSFSKSSPTLSSSLPPCWVTDSF